MHILQTIRYCAYWYFILSKAFQYFTKKPKHSIKSGDVYLCNGELHDECLFKSSNIDDEEWGQFIFIDE